MADSEQIVRSFCDANISLISYNMHGYNQGLHVAKHFADRQSDFILLQEHWLTQGQINHSAIYARCQGAPAATC